MNRLSAGLRVAVEDPALPDITQLLRGHLENAHRLSPPGAVFALDVEALRRPEITFWAAREAGVLLGVGALKALNVGRGEVKSMHTLQAARGRGVGAMILSVILDEALSQGYGELFLETGLTDAYGPARRLYARAGFTECGPFADYNDNGFSHFMRLELQPTRG